MPGPLVAGVFYYAAGIAAARFLALPWWLLMVTGGGLLLAGLHHYRRAWRRNKIYFYALLSILGMLLFQWETVQNRGNISGLAGRPLAFVGTVIEAPDVRSNRINYVVRLDGLVGAQNGLPEGMVPVGRVLLSVYGDSEVFAYGDRLKIAGTPELPKEPGNPGEFDYRRYLNDQGIQLVMRSYHGTGLEKIGRSRVNPLLGFSIAVGSRLTKVLHDLLPEKEAGFMEGLLLGARGRLDDQIREDFALAGLVHVLSVSGFHVGLLAGGLLALGRWFGLPRRIHNPLIILTTGLYALLTGSHPPVIRAVVMTWTMLAAAWTDRTYAWPEALSLAALLILVKNPGALFDAGFQLSFTATWGILYLNPVLQRLAMHFPGIDRRPRAVRFSQAVSLVMAAQLAVLPLCIYYFNYVSLVSLPANLLLVPVVSGIIFIGWFSVVAGMVWLPSAAAAAMVLTWLLRLVFRAVDFLAGLPWAVVSMRRPSPGGIVFYFVALMFLAGVAQKLEIRVRVKRLFFRYRTQVLLSGMILTAVLLWVPMIIPSSEGLKIAFLDVGQGDSAVLSSPGGRTVVIDTGGVDNPLSTFRPGAAVLLPYLRRQGVNTIEILILTHPHQDHIQGAWDLMDRIPVKLLVVSHRFADNPDGQELVRAFREKGTLIKTMGGGERIDFGENMYLEVLNIQNPPQDNENNDSLIIRLSFGRFRTLFLGDAEAGLLSQLAQGGGDLGAQIVKIPHHGSRNAWNPDFYKAVHPGAAIISVGQNNFGHPAPEVIQSLNDMGIRVFRTDAAGAVTITTEGQQYQIKSVKNNGTGN